MVHGRHTGALNQMLTEDVHSGFGHCLLVVVVVVAAVHAVSAFCRMPISTLLAIDPDLSIHSLQLLGCQICAGYN